MQTKHVFNNVIKALKSNSPEILTALGVSGVVTTSYLVGKASFKAAQHLGEGPAGPTIKEKAKETWKLYIPAGISGVLTVGCIIGASKANGICGNCCSCTSSISF